jgi:hypothetical protein
MQEEIACEASYLSHVDCWPRPKITFDSRTIVIFITESKKNGSSFVDKYLNN